MDCALQCESEIITNSCSGGLLLDLYSNLDSTGCIQIWIPNFLHPLCLSIFNVFMVVERQNLIFRLLPVIPNLRIQCTRVF